MRSSADYIIVKVGLNLNVYMKWEEDQRFVKYIFTDV